MILWFSSVRLSKPNCSFTSFTWRFSNLWIPSHSRLPPFSQLNALTTTTPIGAVVSTMFDLYTVTNTQQKAFTSTNRGGTVSVVTSWAAKSEGSLEGWCCRSCQSSILGRALCGSCGGSPGNEAAEEAYVCCTWGHQTWDEVKSRKLVFVYVVNLSSHMARVGYMRRVAPGNITIS